MDPDLESIAPEGRLRAAINTGNRALVQRAGGDLRGVSPALARRLAQEIGATLEPVVYDGAGKVFADAGGGAWDVAFLAIDASRAERVAFTRPYVTIEATYAVRADSRLREVAEVDRDGLCVLVSSGSAYDMHLTQTLRRARLERSGTPAESFEEFRGGRGDVVAGVRESLEEAFAGDAGVRILPDAFHRVEQAMVLSRREDPRIAALDDFVRRAMEENFVRDELAGG